MKLLGENYIYKKCLKRNKKIFPFEESIDILSSKVINIENYDDLIQKIKEEIKNSLWCQDDNDSKDINNFIELYNPKISSNKFSYIGKESRYPVFLPVFIFDKILEPISFIGQLSQPKGIKFLSAYICLTSCSVFYINKSEINQHNNLYKLFQRRVSEDVIKRLFEGHFLFQDTDKNFLIKNYSKYFYVQSFIKGQKIIQQNRPYEGIFFINKGIFQLKTRRTFHELDELKFTIIRNLGNFSKNFSDYKNKIEDIGTKSSKNYENIFEGLNPFQIENFSKERDIFFITYKSPDVVGLNDIIDEKTGLNNFSVECISDEGEAYFLPIEIYTSMSADETIKDNISELVEKQCLLLLREINKNKKLIVEGIKSLSSTSSRKNNVLYLRKNLIDKFQNINPISQRNHSLDYSSISIIKNNNSKNNFSTTFIGNKNIKQRILMNQINKNKTPRLNASHRLLTNILSKSKDNNSNLNIITKGIKNSTLYDKINIKSNRVEIERNPMISNKKSINPFLTYREKFKIKEENKNEISNNEKFQTIRTNKNYINLYNKSKISNLFKQKIDSKKLIKNIKITDKKIKSSIKILKSSALNDKVNKSSEKKVISSLK